MSDLVLALSPDLVLPGERAFVERLETARDGMFSYSAVLTSEDCRELDESAYADARTWYRTPEGTDRTIHDGTSLGRAFEYVATTELIRLYRARRVLERLQTEAPIIRVTLRGVNHEWAFAARELGVSIQADGPLGSGPLPGTRITAPRLYQRTAAGLLSLAARSPRVGLIGARAWAVSYGAAITARWPLEAVEPGPRFVLGMAQSRRSMRSRWLSDAPSGADRASIVPVTDTMPFLASTFDQYAPEMAAASALGMDSARRYPVAVACEDVVPPIRAFLLGFRNAGGRVLTLEHGISGAFSDQIHSVADVLGVWGEPHRRYHSSLAPPGVTVSVLGWPRLEGMKPPVRSDVHWDAVFFAQPTQDLACGSWPERVLSARSMVERYAASHPSRRVAIKPHPSSEAYGWTQTQAVRAHVISGNSLDILRKTRVAILELSTTGIEAMALGIPVVQVGSDIGLGGTEFISESGAPKATDVTELSDAVEHLLTDPSAREGSRARGRAYAEIFVDSLMTPGTAAQRLTEIVKSLEGQHLGV